MSAVREIRIRRGNSLQVRVPVYDTVKADGIEELLPREIPVGAVAFAAVRIGGVSLDATSVAFAADRQSVEVTFDRGVLPEGTGLLEVAVRESETDEQSVARRLIVEASAFDHDT